MMSNIQFLYLVASGNNDSIYKIGISTDPRRRLEQIRENYNVPRAYLVETMDVSTRDEVLALENALHTRFSSKQSNRYGGREFFKLDENDLHWLRSMYQEQSNGFAQAKAYYGLEQKRLELHDEAEQLETVRQQEIRVNRSKGKIYDTTPKGALKQYKQIEKKLSSSHLGRRFSLKRYVHPGKTKLDESTAKVKSVIQEKTWAYPLVTAGCCVGTAVLISVANSVNPAPASMLTGFGGLIAGGFVGGRTVERKTKEANQRMADSLEAKYGKNIYNTLEALIDLSEQRSYLVQDFNESAPQLRKQAARVPRVQLQVFDQVLSQVKKTSYIKPMPLVLSSACSLLVASAITSNLKKNSFVPSVQPVVAQSLSIRFGSRITGDLA